MSFTSYILASFSRSSVCGAGRAGGAARRVRGGVPRTAGRCLQLGAALRPEAAARHRVETLQQDLHELLRCGMLPSRRTARLHCLVWGCRSPRSPLAAQPPALPLQTQRGVLCALQRPILCCRTGAGRSALNCTSQPGCCSSCLRVPPPPCCRSHMLPPRRPSQRTLETLARPGCSTSSTCRCSSGGHGRRPSARRAHMQCPGCSGCF